ncbi:Uncharacterised protein [Nocardia otitidiscaviarum]|uniref:Uncharacterized protein n=1 Tax=Nocardia otitidiscaviarum TaxID=1823 RepID=A0A378Y753_9NOCA|nr:hypothetical protein [Nocardia otitidiscaviarum]SUA72628.1 Uncharacterised protein [Nocardia otitidiscaviarum]SUA72688.1 Uncharacterised protein [Nocardia otitidiscaviarum]
MSDADIIEALRDEVARLKASLEIAEAKATIDAAAIERFKTQVSILRSQRNELRARLFDQTLAEATERRKHAAAKASGGAR